MTKLEKLNKLQEQLVAAKHFTTIQRLSLQVEALRRELGMTSDARLNQPSYAFNNAPHRYINVTTIDENGSPSSTQIFTNDIDFAIQELQARARKGGMLMAFVFDTRAQILRTFDVSYPKGIMKLSEKAVR